MLNGWVSTGSRINNYPNTSRLGLVTGKAIGISIAEIISIFGFLFVGYLLSQYNGDRGYSPRWIKWGFYIFYPLHLIILEAINYFILLP